MTPIKDNDLHYMILAPSTCRELLFIDDKSRWIRATDRLWFRYNPPHTEWWAQLAQWCVRRGKQIMDNYRYWRYVRRL